MCGIIISDYEIYEILLVLRNELTSVGGFVVL